MLHIGGCSSPSSRPWACRWRTTNICDVRPVRRQTYGYLPSRKASPPIGWYQTILLADRDTCVTCFRVGKFLPSYGKTVFFRREKNSPDKNSFRQKKRTVFGRFHTVWNVRYLITFRFCSNSPAYVAKWLQYLLVHRKDRGSNPGAAICP